MSKEKKSQKYRMKIFLIKNEEDYKINNNILKKGDEYETEYPKINGKENKKDVFYYSASTFSAPKWYTGFLGLESSINAASIKGVMFREVKVEDYRGVETTRKFAICFNGGDLFLRPESYVVDFGLKIALNLNAGFYDINIDKISTSTNNLKERARKLKNINEFEITYGLDLLKGVTVQPNDESLIKSKLIGASSISFTEEVTLQNLNDPFIKFLYKSFTDEKYKTNYPWVEYIKEIKENPSLIEKLKDQAYKQFDSRDAGFWFTMPDINMKNVSCFKMYKSGTSVKKSSEIYFIEDESIYFALAEINEIKSKESEKQNSLKDDESQEQLNYDIASLDDFKKYKFNIVNETGTSESNAFDLFNCIYCEFELDEKNYTLNEGRFYEIDKSYTNRIKTSYSNLKTSALNYSDYNATQAEGEYIKDITKNEVDYINLDKKTVMFDTAIEVCDVYDKKNNAIVHIKKESSSAALSHLFSQVRVSSNLLADKEKRCEIIKQLNEKYEVPLSELNKLNDLNFKIIFAFISKKEKDGFNKINLPFFSKLNLVKTVEDLDRIGYKNIELMFIKANADLYNNKKEVAI